MIYKKLSLYVLFGIAIFGSVRSVYSQNSVEALRKTLAESYRKDIAFVENKNSSLLEENARLKQEIASQASSIKKIQKSALSEMHEQIQEFAKYKKSKQHELEVWQQDLYNREFDYINKQNKVSLDRLESDADMLVLRNNNAALVQENKRLKGQGGTLTTVARYIDNGDYKEALTTIYNDISTKAKNAYDAAVNFVSENPYATGAAVAGVTWVSIVYAMRSSYGILTRPYTIASCMAELPVTQLESLDQGGVTEMLIDYIYTMYRTGHDEYKVGSAYVAESRFYKDLLAELYAAECYMWWASVIPHWTLRKLFLFDETVYENLPERIERLHYYKRLFLRWVDARNDAAAQPAGPGFGGGLSGLLG